MEQRAENGSDAPGTVKLLWVQIGEKRYALEVGRVNRVTSVPQLTPVPHATEAIVGIGRESGDVVVYLDGGVLANAGTIDAETAVLLERTADQTPVGLLATETDGMESVSVGRIVPAAEVGLDTAVFAAGVTGDDRTVPLFGPDRLVSIADQRRG